MTEQEKQERLMYEIIGRISNINAPIVFKGALITKLILRENGYTDMERPTNDIDANWIGEPPAMDELADLINRSVKPQNGVYAESERSYAPGKSAGIRFIDNESGVKLFTMDISIKPVFGDRVYHYGEATIRGVLPDTVLCDKISVLSGERIFRRFKDVLDVYALAHCLDIRITDIYYALERNERVLGTFDAFLTRRADLEHAYGKMRGVIGMPDFNSVYVYLEKFLVPFITHDRNPKIWLGDEMSWRDVRERKIQKKRTDRETR